jgi:asparagine synthase (glutamine-hydrolysing)
MCGIAGILHTRGGRAVDQAGLEHMAGALAHRGPDGHGVWSEGPIGLAHRRLAIIDLAGGRQPMVSRATGATLTFNGEIYNFRELRGELKGLGAGFDEQSDTEVVLRAYEHWGDLCVHHLRGMFAFALWDPRTRRLFAARDRLGIKPFFYRWDGETLVFASELKALAALHGVPLEVDGAAFESYLRLQYVPAPGTFVRDIRHLQPGRTLTVGEDGRLQEERFWEPKAAPGTGRSDVEEFRLRMADAVKSHLVADVPVGALLSGGVDSSLIVAHMSAQAMQPVHTFSVGFEGGPRFDERGGAREVAARFHTIHHERLVTDEDAAAVLPAIVSRMDEPLADYAALPTYFVAEVAARTVKVILTGEGADELFGGYHRYRMEGLLAPFSRWRRPYQATHLFSHREIGRLLGTATRRGLRGASDAAGVDPVNRACARDIEGWLADDLLVKVDRMTMLCSLEARVPYLDHPFVEFALRVPGPRKIDLLRGTRKILLREAAAGLLPPEILSRPKHGFTPPIDAWLRGRLGSLAREILLDPSSRLRTRVDPREIDGLLTGHARGRRNGHKIWSLLVYELWSRHHAAA